ncbi:MAG: hypothetical protein MRY21_03330 [Simkaniaceae bacterium]|nr:hypothetical protein [Simkaniaceae bacterium]
MRKIVYTLCSIGILLIILFSALFVGYRMVPVYLSGKLTHLMGVDVTIDKFQLGWKHFNFQNFVIDNPPKSSLPLACKVEKIQFDAPFNQYFRPHIKINEIAFDNVYVSIEFYDSSNKEGNWVTIMQSLTRGDQQPETKPLHARTVQIDELVLRNVNITLKRYGKNALRLVPLKEVRLKNINSEKGLPMEEISQIVIRQAIKSISLASGIGDMLEGFVTVPEKAVKSIFTPFSLFFGNDKSKEKDEKKSAPETPATRGRGGST